jgi:capsule polysaccharide export protein KpsE/RkpR
VRRFAWAIKRARKNDGNRSRLTQLAVALQFAPNAMARESMTNAVEKIVDTYVQLNDRHALGDLRTYRQKLAVLLKAQTGLNFSLLIGQINEEIALIEAGLARLNPAHSA